MLIMATNQFYFPLWFVKFGFLLFPFWVSLFTLLSQSSTTLKKKKKAMSKLRDPAIKLFGTDIPLHSSLHTDHSPQLMVITNLILSFFHFPSLLFVSMLFFFKKFNAKLLCQHVIFVFCSV